MRARLRRFTPVVFLALPGCGALDEVDEGLGGVGPDSDRNAPCPEAETPESCQVIVLVNEERRTQGLSPLRFDPSLARAAEDHARDMFENGYFDHVSRDGRDFADRCEQAGYAGFATGENIAKGQRSPEDVMDSWMSSSGHRSNILSANSNEIGVGVVERHWVQNFGRHP